MRKLLALIDRRLAWILLLALLARCAFYFVYREHNSLQAMEYGTIASNIISGQGYSYLWKSSGQIATSYVLGEQSLQPSAYMMPGYTLFITALYYTTSPPWTAVVLMLLQSVAAMLSIVLARYWLRATLNESVALIVCWTIALLPEFILAANLAASVALVHLLSLLLCSVNWWYRPTLWRRSLLLLSAALLISIRAEALLFLAVLSIYYLFRSKGDRAVLIIAGLVLVLAPWTLRNYMVFDSVVPLTTSGGLNLYRGHNPYAVGTWSDERINTAINALPFDRRIELRVDSLYRREAMQSIAAQPLREVQTTFEKLLALYSIDTSDPRAWNPAYWLPSIVIGLCALIGLFFIRGLRPRMGWETNLYIASSTITTAIFFCLPRYQSMLRIVLLPYAAIVVWKLIIRLRPALAQQSFETETKD